MFRYQVRYVSFDCLVSIFFTFKFIQYFFQARIIYLFRNAQFFFICIRQKGMQIHHHIRKDLYRVLFRLDHHKRDRRILDLCRLLLRDDGSCLGHHFSRHDIHDVFCQRKACDTVAEGKLFIKFITSDLCQIIAPHVKKHAVDQAFRAVHRKRFARTEFLIQFQKTILIVLGRIFRKTGNDLRLFPEQVEDLLVRSHTERADQHRDRHFSVPVNTHIKNIIGVRLIFQPRPAVRNNGRGIQFLSDLIVGDPVINTGGTHKLAYNNTFCTIDDKCTRLRHEWQISHENVMFTDFFRFFIMKSYLHF